MGPQQLIQGLNQGFLLQKIIASFLGTAALDNLRSELSALTMHRGRQSGSNPPGLDALCGQTKPWVTSRQ